MRIDRIICRNLRAIADLDLEVREHLVLVGPNASGKTSLLRALDVVLAGSFGQLVNSFSPDSLRDPVQPLEIVVRFTDFTDDDRATFADEINVAEPGDAPDESLTLAVTIAFDGEEPQVTRVFSKPGEDRRVRAEHLAAMGWGYLPATRSPEHELGSGRRSALRLLVASLDLGDDRERLEALVDEADTLLDGAEPVVDLRRQLAGALSSVLPNEIAAGDLSVHVSSGHPGNPTDKAEVRLQGELGEPAPLHKQSDGLRALSTVVVQRLASPKAVLAVDEPEIHLHPRSQARLGQFLAAGSGQRIVATHSSPVLCAFAPADVVALVGGGVRQLDPAKVAAAPKLFAQWWVDAALEPLTSTSVVFVEGPSDRLLLLRAASLRDRDLDRMGCSVVVMHGTEQLAPNLHLFGPGGFDLLLRGLVDTDAIPIVAGKLGTAADQASLMAAGWRVSDPDLEGECVAGLGVGRHVELMCASGYYNEQQILGVMGAPDVAGIDADRYTAWLRGGKLIHASALASTMNSADAGRITSLAAIADDIAT